MLENQLADSLRRCMSLPLASGTAAESCSSQGCWESVALGGEAGSGAANTGCAGAGSSSATDGGPGAGTGASAGMRGRRVPRGTSGPVTAARPRGLAPAEPDSSAATRRSGRTTSVLTDGDGECRCRGVLPARDCGRLGGLEGGRLLLAGSRHASAAMGAVVAAPGAALPSLRAGAAGETRRGSTGGRLQPGRPQGAGASCGRGLATAPPRPRELP
mmetsp:Transcript_35981/g.107477  ORF Transcript_35981/g.107477 Transcript_35981/m.107477 type:complete len:216 (+) Transcript_35981:267-914(+)